MTPRSRRSSPRTTPRPRCRLPRAARRDARGRRDRRDRRRRRRLDRRYGDDRGGSRRARRAVGRAPRAGRRAQRRGRGRRRRRPLVRRRRRRRARRCGAQARRRLRAQRRRRGVRRVRRRAAGRELLLAVQEPRPPPLSPRGRRPGRDVLGRLRRDPQGGLPRRRRFRRRALSASVDRGHRLGMRLVESGRAIWLAPDVQATHLKVWRLPNLLHTEISAARCRGRGCCTRGRAAAPR